MKKSVSLLFSFCAVVLCFLSFSGYAQGASLLKKMDKELSKILQTTQTPGFAIAIVNQDGVVFQKGYGYRDLENKIPVDEQTLFAIGSTSKAFTTALLGHMREEHDLSFEDSPRDYLPQLKFHNKQLNAEVTILDMISHRTGLPRHDYSWYLWPEATRDEMLERVKYQEPFEGLREKWYYNNFMYLAQGQITAKLTGKSWEENIQDYFFAPLEMTQSNTSISELEAAKNKAFGYELVNFESSRKMDYFKIGAMGPAGSINSSVSEMSNWLQTWINGGQYKGNQIIPEEYVQEALNPVMLIGKGISDPAFPDIHLASYSYAWFIESYKGHYRLEHGGNIDGFSANVAFFPTDSLGIVVLCNQNGSAVPKLARNIASDHVLGLAKSDWLKQYSEKIEKLKSAQAESSKEEESKTEVEPAHPISAYTGSYNHPGYGSFEIAYRNDSLVAEFERISLLLKPKAYDVFNSYDIKNGEVDPEEESALSFNFIADNNGDIAELQLQLEPTLDPIPFSRKPIAIEISDNQLAQWVGDYSLSGAVLNVAKSEKGALILTVPNQPKYTLSPNSESEFFVEGLKGYKVKFEEEGDEVVMKLVQPNGVFAAKKVTE